MKAKLRTRRTPRPDRNPAMFGIDLSELVVILVVALVVVGPERLPKVARTLGHLWGRGQRYVNNVKADISRDMATEDIRKLQEQVQQEANSAGQAVSHAAQSIDQQVQQIDSSMIWPEQIATPQIPRRQQPAPQQKHLSS